MVPVHRRWGWRHIEMERSPSVEEREQEQWDAPGSPKASAGQGHKKCWSCEILKFIWYVVFVVLFVCLFSSNGRCSHDAILCSDHLKGLQHLFSFCWSLDRFWCTDLQSDCVTAAYKFWQTSLRQSDHREVFSATLSLYLWTLISGFVIFVSKYIFFAARSSIYRIWVKSLCILSCQNINTWL